MTNQCSGGADPPELPINEPGPDLPDLPPVVDMRKIGKSFEGVAALRDIDFRVTRNEIVGLIGDNGAGKSTLIKILSGLHPPDAGELYIKGHLTSPGGYSIKQARKYGVETVYQERSLGEKQPLWRNVFTGRHLTNRFGLIDIRREMHETEHILRDMLGLTGIGARPDSLVKVLSGGERQGLAIGRAMYFDADLVILDEPTTALSLKEVDKVLNFILAIKKKRKSCIFITHNLAHVYQVADRFVLMDRGRVVGDYLKRDLTLDGLSEILLTASNSRAALATPGG